MRPKLAFAWFLVSLALTALLIVQWRSSTEKLTKLERLQVQFEQLDAQHKAAQVRAQELDKENLKLRGELRSAEVEAGSLRAAAAAPAVKAGTPPSASPASSGSSGSQNFLANIMQDPEMRKAMEQQQRLALESMYGPLFKKLNLTPDEEARLKDLVLTNQLGSMQHATALMDPNATNRAELMAQIKEQSQAREQQMKSLLGDERYQQFQDYTQTAGERMMLEQFGKNIELEPEQVDQLLSVMLEEKKNAQINQPTPDLSDPSAAMEVMQSEQLLQKQLEQQEWVDQRVLDRAQQFLAPEQWQKLAPFMSNRTAMTRMGITMARKMMAPEKTAQKEP